jgi:hypothetical protein
MSTPKQIATKDEVTTALKNLIGITIMGIPPGMVRLLCSLAGIEGQKEVEAVFMAGVKGAVADMETAFSLPMPEEIPTSPIDPKVAEAIDAQMVGMIEKLTKGDS